MRWFDRLWARGLFAAASVVLGTQAAWAKVTIQGDAMSPGGKLYQFHIEGIEFQSMQLEGQEFKKARLQGVEGYEAVLFEEGQPELPVVRFFADGDVKVSVGQDKFLERLLGPVQLVPNQVSRVKLPAAAAPTVTKDIRAYQRRTLAPEQPYKIEKAGSINGVPRYQVTLYPMSYAAGTQNYSLIRNFEVRVKTPRDAKADKPEAFVFIVGRRFADSPSLAAYAALKESLGYTVEHVVVEQGEDSAAIRAKVKEVYARPATRLTHALIIGEASDVPGKDADFTSGWTDHYYAAIDTDDYKSDINGPDIGIGRVSVDDEAQLAVVLGKFTRYQTGEFTSQRWLNEVSFIATDDRYQVAEASHNYAIQTYTSPHGHRGIFPAADQEGGDQLYAITHRVSDEKVFEAMDLGRAIINYSGHGSMTSWAGPHVSQADVRRLTDRDALPFVVSNACITGDYRISEAFAETWQRHDAGAIVFWGSMDNTYWDEDDILERRMYDRIYRDGQLQFANLTQYALAEHWRHYGGQGRAKYYWETYHLFGDPSLELRMVATRGVEIHGPEVLPLGASEASYTITDDKGAALAGVRVALSIPGRSYTLTGMTDQDGQVRFDIAAAARDVTTFKITVSGGHVRLTSSELKIIPADTAYLSLTQFFVNDRTESIVYPGEDVSLGFSVSNLGQQPTAGARVFVESLEGPATLLASETAVPGLQARDVRVVNEGNLRLALSETASSGDPVKLRLVWETDEGQRGEVSLTLRVARGDVAIEGLDFGTTEGGGIRPGETGEVFVQVKNTGTEALKNARLIPVNGSCVAHIDGELLIESLEPGASVRLDQALAVTVDGSCLNGEAVAFGLQGSYTSVATSLPLAAETSFPAGVLATMSVEANELGLSLPDGGAAVEKELDVWFSGPITDVSVAVGISHTYIGDLVVKLVHPDGTTVVLHDRRGGSERDLNRTYGFDGVALADLAKFIGKPAEGVWKLIVQDQARQDLGTLNSIKLQLRGHFN